MVISQYKRPYQRVIESAAFVPISAFLLFAGVAPMVELPGLQGVLLGVPWIAIWVFMTYWLLFRKPFSMELTATELRWHTMFQVKSCPLGQVEAIRIEEAGERNTYYARIRLSGRRGPLMISAEFSWPDFAADIKAAAPHVTMTAPGDWPPSSWRRRRSCGRPSGEQ